MSQSATEQYKFVIKHFNELPPDIKTILTSESNISPAMLKCICELCYNLLKHNIDVTSSQKSRLFKYKNGIKCLAGHSVSKSRKRKKLKQIGKGFLPLLFSIIGPVIASLLN